MKLLFLILSLILPQVMMAQEADADPYAECAAVLASAPANQLAEMSKDGTYGKIDKLLHPYILGMNCSVDQIIEYMENAGWEFKRLLEYDSLRETYRYSFDTNASFCLPERGLWRLFNHCGGGAAIYWGDGEITWISIGPPIRFGG